MNIHKYLERIHFDLETNPTKEVLFALQRNHLLYIPFENLDIHYGRKIILGIENSFQKIIINKRGGFCYELNSLFNELLKLIGFDTILISGRVYNNETYGKEFDHMAIVVNLKNTSYLVDVGFGKFIFEPLELVLEVPQIDQNGTFVIDMFDKDYFRVSKVDNEKREPEYIFSLIPRQLNDFEEMCNFHQTSNQSHFTRSKVISLAKPNGRITLTNNTLKISNTDITEITEFKDAEFEKYLNMYFDINIE